MSLIDDRYQLYDIDQFSNKYRSFFDSVDTGSLNSTLYQAPDSSIRDSFERASKLVILNQGHLSDSEREDQSTDYLNRLQSRNINVVGYSSPENIRRLHIKSYIGTRDNEEVALISTGNLSKSTLTAIPENKLVRKFNNFFRKELYQTNVGIELTNKQDIKDLKDIHQQIITKQDAVTRGNFLVGQDVSTSLIRDLKGLSRKADVTIASPYLDDPNLAIALSDLSIKGANIRLITSNPDSNVERGTGGNRRLRREQLTMLQQSGVDIYMPDVNDPVLAHTKAAVLIDGDTTISNIGSHNYTRAANAGESLDLQYRSINKDLAQTLRETLLSSTEKLNFNKLKGNTTLRDMRDLGITNNQLTPFFDSESEVKFILPSQYGASYFYERAIYAANRDQAGLSTYNIIDTEGIASSAYKLSYLAKHKVTTSKVPWYVENYDREMATPGLSYYVNKWSIRHGWGRIYKEEDGPLASLAGAVGRVLDNSLVYASSNLPDHLQLQEELNPLGTYTEPKEGFFQSSLSFVTNFTLQSTQAVLTYFLLGVPFGIASAELFNFSAQGLVDIALNQSKSNGLISNVVNRKAATMLSIGVNYGGIGNKTLGSGTTIDSAERLKAQLWRMRDKETGEVKNIYKPGFNSLFSAINLLQNQRAGIFFDVAVRPFVEDVINPYSPRGNARAQENFQHLKAALDGVKEAVTANIYGKFDNKEFAKANFTLQNGGYEKAKKIAKAIDLLGSYMPFNPTKWGLLGKNYGQASMLVEEGRITQKNFLAFSEVLNFNQLLNTLDRIYYGGEFLRIVNRGTYVDETSAVTNLVAKFKSSFAVPKTIFGKGVNILAQGVRRLTNTDGLSELLKQNKSLRKVETELLNKALHWDTKSQSRVLRGTEEEVHKFLAGVLSYELSIDEASKFGLTRELMTHKASDFYSEQNFNVANIKNPYKLLDNNSFLKNRGNLGTMALIALGVNLAASDLFTATTGASLMSQLITAVHHREVGAAPDFAPTRLFGWGGSWQATAASVGYTSFAIAMGYSIGVLQTLHAPNADRYLIAKENLQFVASFKAKLAIAAPEHMARFSKVISGSNIADNFTLYRPKGNFLQASALATVSILAAKHLVPWAVSSGLQMIRSIPFLGEALFGKGNTRLNDKTSVVQQLIALRADTIRRNREGDPTLTSLEAGAAYHLGAMIGLVPITDAKEQSKDTRIKAEQSPLPYFQFFMTQVNEGRYYDSENNVLARGRVAFKFGMQTAPMFGVNISFSSPISLDLDKKNSLGFNGSLVYHDEADNVLNYFGAIGSLGFTAFTVAGTMIAALDTMAYTAGLPMFSFLNKDNRLVTDVKEASNMVKSTFKTFNNGLDLFVALPTYASNLPKAIFQDRVEVFKALGLGGKNFLGSAKHSTRLTSRLLKAGVGAYFLTTALMSAADIFEVEDKEKGLLTIATATASFSSLFFADKLINPIASKLGNLGRRVSQMSKLTEKIPFVPRKNKYYFAALALAAGWAWLATDSSFGISEGMDRKYDSTGEYTTDWVKKLITVGLYTSTFVPVLAISDIGKNPADILKEYSKGKAMIANYNASVSSFPNPLKYLQSQYVAFKTWSQGKYLNSYLDKTPEYLAKITPITAAELSASIPSKDVYEKAVKLVKQNKTAALDDIITNSNLRQGIETLWSRQDFIKLSKGWTTAGKFTLAAIATVGIATMVSTVIHNIGYAKSGRTDQQAVNAFYDWADGFEPLANLTRLLTFQDKQGYDNILHSNQVLDESGRAIAKKGSRLINPTNPQQQKMTRVLNDIMAPFIVDAQNSYQAVLPMIGVTIRQGEYGIRYNVYSQTQSALQDTSYAIYSTLPSYMFRMALNGNRQLQFLVQEGITRAKAIENPVLRSQALHMAGFNASAQLAPLKDPRKFSNPITESTMAMIGGDSLLSRSLQLRTRRTSELSYQRLESIASILQDPFTSSIMTTFNNEVDIDNPLASVNQNEVDQELLAKMDPKHLASLLRGIFATNNRISLGKLEITRQTDPRKINIRKEEIENPTEMLSQLSLQLSTENLETHNPFGFLMTGFKLFDNAISFFSFGSSAAKLGLYAGIGLATTFTALGAVGSLMYSKQNLRFQEAFNLTRNLFNVNDDGLSSAFVARNRIVGQGQPGGFQIFGKQSRQFQVNLPQGAENLDLKDVNNMLQHVMSGVQESTTLLQNQIFGVTDNLNTQGWSGEVRSEIISQLDLDIGKLVDTYVDSIIDRYTTASVGSTFSLADITTNQLSTPEEILEVKTRLKAELRQNIQTTLSEEIARTKVFSGDIMGDDLLAKIKYKLGDATKRQADELARKVIASLQPFMQQWQKNLYFLESEDALGYGARLSREVAEMFSTPFMVGSRNVFTRKPGQLLNSRSPIPQIKAQPGDISPGLKAELDAIELVNPTFRKRAVLSELPGAAMNTIATVNTFFDTLDSFNTFNRLAAYQSDPDRTEGEINFAAEHAGMTVTNVIVGSVISNYLLKAGKKLVKSGFKSRTRAAIILTLLGMTAIYTAHSWNSIKSKWSSMTEAVTNNKLYKGVTGVLGSAYEGLVGFVGDSIVNIDKVLSRIPVVNWVFQPGVFTQTLGVGVTVASALYGLGRGIVVAGVYGLAAALTGGAVQRVFPGFSRWSSGILTPFLNTISQIPFIGGFLANHTSQPLGLSSNQFYQEGSPIYISTAQEAIAHDSSRYLQEAGDVTGNRTKALFGNPTYSGQGYRSDEPQAQLGGWTRSKPLLSPMIEREAAIRGQYYNQAVIGTAMWAKMIYGSENYKELKQITHLQKIGNPYTQHKLKASEAQLDKDIKELQTSVKQRSTGGYVTPVNSALIKSIAENNTNVVTQSGYEVKTSIQIESKNTINKNLNTKVEALTTEESSAVVLTYSTKAEKVNDKVVVNNKIAHKNDLYMAVSRGQVNPYFATPGFTP